MNEQDETPSTGGEANEPRFRIPIQARCATCDSVVTKEDERCLMCGAAVTADIFVKAATRAAKEALRAQRAANPALRREDQPLPTPSATPPEAVEPSETEAEAAPADEEMIFEEPIFEEVEIEIEAAAAEPTSKLEPAVDITPSTPAPREIEAEPEPNLAASPEPAAVPPPWRPSAPFLGVIGLAILIAICGALTLRNMESEAAVALAETVTPFLIATETTTAEPTAPPTFPPTAEASPTFTVTPTPLPTDTPRPPRFHSIQSGETLTSVALTYGITILSIAEANSFEPDTQIQQGQQIIIPWPSPTPPLQPIQLTFGEDSVVVDPSVCPPFYEIQEGDSLFQVASRNNVPLEALLELNRLTVDSILKPGDASASLPSTRAGWCRLRLAPPPPLPTRPHLLARRYFTHRKRA